jgi:hypothetical protein
MLSLAARVRDADYQSKYGGYGTFHYLFSDSTVY